MIMLATLFGDQYIFITVLMCMFLCLGVGTIILGIVWRVKGTLGNTASWYRDLVAWHVVDPTSDSSSVVDVVRRYMGFVQSSAVIGTGVAVLVCVASVILLLCLVPASQDALRGEGIQFFVAYLYLLAMLGMGAGFAVGMMHTRSTMRRTVKYADAQARRVSDYRSPLLPWLFLLPFGFSILMTVIITPHVGALLHIPSSDSPFTLANNPFTLSIIPSMMLVLFGVLEFLLRRIVALPRSPIALAPEKARRADDMMRATTIGSLLYIELLAVAALMTLQQYLLFSGLSLPLIRHYFGFLSSSLWLFALLQLLGLAVLVVRGRLGGRYTGWPWTKRKALHVWS